MSDWDTKPFADKIVPGAPGHVICGDLGWHSHNGPPEWCTCEAAQERRRREPELLIEIETDLARIKRKYRDLGEHA